MKKMNGATAILLVTTGFQSASALAESESWYTMWGLGASRHHYTGDMKAATDTIVSAPGIDRTQISLDLLGFYFPLDNKRTAVGFVVNETADNFAGNIYTTQLTYVSYGLSSMHYFGKEIGDGFFLRGDIAASRAVLTTNVPGIGEQFSNWGTGALLGVGYGFPVSEQSRILLGINYTGRYIEQEYYGATELVFAGLW